MHSRHLHPLICGIFLPNSVNVARYASFIWQKSPTNCRIHLSESNFQTRSRRGTGCGAALQGIPCIAAFPFAACAELLQAISL
ncbi:DUF6783 domain-containing protein [Lachnospiraceae bacterium JLR.KK009]